MGGIINQKVGRKLHRVKTVQKYNSVKNPEDYRRKEGSRKGYNRVKKSPSSEAEKVDMRCHE